MNTRNKPPKTSFFAVILLLVIAALFLASAANAAEISGVVVKVHDGDTVNIQDDGGTIYKVRLAEIDAPELAQPFGKESRDSLADMLKFKTVKLDYDSRDQYGRVIGRITLDGVDVNTAAVRKGLAWFYPAYGKDQAIKQVEEIARALEAGLWADPNPVPPWEYRKNKKRGK
jgi:endonuclease YncB( thermonuclease family)